MNEQEFLALPPKAAAQHLANCPDDEALPLLVKYAAVNRYAIDWLLGQVRRAKGTKPSYYDEALKRSADAWYAGRSISADIPTPASQSSASPLVTSSAHSPLFGWGIALAIVGVIAIAVAFFFDVSVETGELERVANVNLISIREMICWCGGFMFIGGLVLLAADGVCGAISSARERNTYQVANSASPLVGEAVIGRASDR